MCNKSIAQEIAESLRITRENPFADYLRAVCSEWLQLVLVIERIKLDSKANKLLTELVTVVNEVMRHERVRAYCAKHSSAYANNPTMGLETFFHALDQNRKAAGYMALVFHPKSQNHSQALRANRAQERNEKNGIEDVLIDIVPRILDECNFSWRNLNALRLGYSHSQIVNCLLEHNKLTNSVEEAMSFIEKGIKKNEMFAKLRVSAIETYIQAKQSRNALPNTFQADDLLHRADLVADINEAILRSMAAKTIALAKKTGMFFPYDGKSSNIVVNKPEVSDSDIPPFNGKKTLTIRLDSDEMISAVREGRGDLYFRTLQEKVHCTVEELKKIEEDQFAKISSTEYEALQQSISELKRSDFILLHKKRDYYLAAEVILRGARCSHWLWTHPPQMKTTIRAHVNQYCKEENKRGIVVKENTVLQNYEDIRKHAKESIANLVLCQVEERQHLRTALLPVLNASIIKECYDLMMVLKKCLPDDIARKYGCLRWYLAAGEKARQKLLDDEESGSDLNAYRFGDFLNCFDLDEATIQNIRDTNIRNFGGDADGEGAWDKQDIEGTNMKVLTGDLTILKRSVYL